MDKTETETDCPSTNPKEAGQEEEHPFSGGREERVPMNDWHRIQHPTEIQAKQTMVLRFAC